MFKNEISMFLQKVTILKKEVVLLILILALGAIYNRLFLIGVLALPLHPVVLDQATIIPLDQPRQVNKPVIMLIIPLTFLMY